MARAEFQVSDLRTGVTRLLTGPSGVLVQTVGKLQRRIIARAKQTAPVDSGVLRNSHFYDPPRVVGLSVTGDVYNSANYARAVHDGVQERVIVPVNARALHFRVGGRDVFARRVVQPARPGRPWLLNATEVEAPRLGFQVRPR